MQNHIVGLLPGHQSPPPPKPPDPQQTLVCVTRPPRLRLHNRPLALQHCALARVTVKMIADRTVKDTDPQVRMLPSSTF